MRKNTTNARVVRVFRPVWKLFYWKEQLSICTNTKYRSSTVIRKRSAECPRFQKPGPFGQEIIQWRFFCFHVGCHAMFSWPLSPCFSIWAPGAVFQQMITISTIKFCTKKSCLSSYKIIWLQCVFFSHAFNKVRSFASLVLSWFIFHAHLKPMYLMKLLYAWVLIIYHLSTITRELCLT